jgi:iron uptake system component EfeO
VPDQPEQSDRPARRWPWSRKATGLTVLGVVVVAVAALVITDPFAPTPVAAGPGPTTLTLSNTDCGNGWTNPHAGRQDIVVRNEGDAGAEVDLIDVGTGKVYGEIEGLGQGTAESMTVSLAPGKYALRCLVEDVETMTGPTVTIGGTGTDNPGAVVVTQTDLLGPLKQYQDYVDAGVATLVAKTDALQAAAHSGGTAAAEAAWLPAHLAYESLGAAYDAFGDFDGEINGTTAGLPDGVNDKDFTGFHKVEYDLWHGAPAATTAADADALDGFVHGLQADLPNEETQAIDLGLRTHEIIENAVQFELTGKTDEGSGTNLATIDANLAGDREVLSVLRPLLASRYPQLPQVDQWSARLETLLQAQHHPDGSWTPVQQLDQPTREKLNGALSELTEVLAPIAAITEPRRANS